MGAVTNLAHFSFSALLGREWFDYFVAAFTLGQIAILDRMNFVEAYCTFAVIVDKKLFHLRVLHFLQLFAS